MALAETVVLHSADMQFQGQTHILNVAIPGRAADLDTLRSAFADAYWRRFRVALPEIGPVLVNLHTAVIGRRPPIPVGSLAEGERAASVAEARVGTRRVWFPGGARDTPVYERDRLPIEGAFTGPAILEQLDATTVIEPGDRARVDALGNVLISIGEGVPS